MHIIDVHAHIFPERIALKAAMSIGDFYNIRMKDAGTLGRLLEYGEQGGIDHFVIHSVATTAEQIVPINDFVSNTVKENNGKLTGFATLHPSFEDLPGEVARVKQLGLKGVKLHPDFQRFPLDSKEAYKIYEIIEDDMPLLVHTGDNRYHYSNPSLVRPVMRDFPRLKLICAHFGGYSEWNEAEECLKGLNVYVDTSSSMFLLSAERARQLINGFGTDYVMFGSDYPMWSPANEAEIIKGLGFENDILEKIMYKTAAELLGVTL